MLQNGIYDGTKKLQLFCGGCHNHCHDFKKVNKAPQSISRNKRTIPLSRSWWVCWRQQGFRTWSVTSIESGSYLTLTWTLAYSQMHARNTVGGKARTKANKQTMTQKSRLILCQGTFYKTFVLRFRAHKPEFKLHHKLNYIFCFYGDESMKTSKHEHFYILHTVWVCYTVLTPFNHLSGLLSPCAGVWWIHHWRCLALLLEPFDI